MNCTTFLSRLASVVLVTCLISSCDRDSGQHAHDEVIQLQTELEQLANQVGRLEFRIFQLEDQLSSQTSAGETGAQSDTTPATSGANVPAEPASEDGHFDLTPVEP